MQALTKPVRIVVATEREARERTEKIRTTFKNVSTMWLTLGREVAECLEKQVPAALEMNAQEWMQMCFAESVSKVKRALRIAKALTGVPEATLAQLTEGKAYDLTLLPEKARKSEEWLKKALTLTNDQFREEVNRVLNKKGPQHRDEYVDMFPRMPITLLEMFEEVEKKLAAQMGLDTVERPGLRSVIWERVIAMLFTTPIEIVAAEIEGGEIPHVD